MNPPADSICQFPSIRSIVWPLAVIFVALAGPRALALNSAEKPANYTVTRWDTEEGLPHNSIKQIYQSHDGYLWVGTQQGLARFDGLSFTTFNEHNTPGLPNSQITSFAETRDGSLWIGTSFGLARYQNGRFTAYGRADGLKADTVNSVCVAPDGSLWIGGRAGITRWLDGKFVNDIDTTGYDTLALRKITVDSQGAMWISTGTDALRFHDGKIAHFGRAEGLPAQQLQMVREDAEKHIIAVTQNGLFRLENERFVAFEQNASLSSPRVDTVFTDRAGNLWIGSIGGLDRYVDGKVVPYIDRNGSRLGVVDALFEDREGCLWIGTSAGLYRLTDRRAYSLSAEDGVAGTLVTGIAQTRDNAILVATWGGGVDRFQNGTVTHLTAGTPLSHETVTTIYEAPDGTIWLGNRGSSLDRLENDNKVTTFVYQPGVATSRPVTAIYADPSGELLLGISKRGLLQLRDGQIVPVSEAAEFAPETVWTLDRTRDGRLLMGTSKGLYERQANRTWKPVDLEGVPQPVIVRALFEDTTGVIWMATDGRGLIRWEKGSARSYGSREGMVDDTLFGVVEDNVGSIWVTSARGIARIRKTSFGEVEHDDSASLNSMTFGRVDGLSSASTAGSGFPSTARLADGRLMIATDKGVAVIDPRLIQVNYQPPTIAIEGVVADDRPLELGETVTVPAGTNRLVIRYTALSLIAPQQLRFRYQLDGSDSRWVDAGHDRSARYTHLAPGSYTFHLLACNNDGIWNATGVTLGLTIQPLFYQTLWFRLAAAALLIATIGSIGGLRVRQFKLRQAALARTNAELDQRVRDRTAELSRSNDELQQRELLFRLIFEHAPVGISWKRTDLGPNYHFNATFRRILDLPADAPPADLLLSEFVHPEDAPRQAELEALVRSGEADSYTLEQRFVRKDGRLVWGLLAAAVVRDQQGTISQVIGLLEDITARKQAEQELAATYKRLMEASRMAGMAEVATGVLHNVGNVLNSVNVSASVLADGLRQSRLGSLFKLTGMLHQHAGNMAQFLTEDPKGQRVLPYLDTLADHLSAEQERFVAEVESLRGNVEHIKEIVARQQSYAQLGGLLEKLSPVELFEDALHMHSIALTRHGVEVVRDFSSAPPVIAERHKVLQILINIVQNAKQALNAAGSDTKKIHVQIARHDEKVRFVISDNGVGIPPENLSRIFEHGFTTRSGGHGFGLHSSANAAKEMHGSLSVHSDGPGKGAVFTLELPVAMETATAIAPGPVSR